MDVIVHELYCTCVVGIFPQGKIMKEVYTCVYVGHL